MYAKVCNDCYMCIGAAVILTRHHVHSYSCWHEYMPSLFFVDPYAEFHAYIIFRGVSKRLCCIVINYLSRTFPRVTEYSYIRFAFKSLVYTISSISLLRFVTLSFALPEGTVSMHRSTVLF